MTSGEDQAAADIDADPTGEESSTDDSQNLDAFEATNLKDYEAAIDRMSDEPQEQSADDVDQEVPAAESHPEEEDHEEASEQSDDDEESEEEAETDEDEGDSEEDPEGEEEEAEEDDKPARYRIQTKDPVEAEALALRKRHRDWSLSKCLDKAREILGVTDDAGTDGPENDSEPARTVAEATEELKNLRQKRNEALKNIEMDEAADLSDQIDALTDEIADLRVSEQQKAQKETQAFDDRTSQSMAKAVNYYPDSADPDSALVKEMHRISDLLKETGDSRLENDPDAPFKLTQQAAQNLGLFPRDPKAKPAKQKQKTVRRRPAHQPASGSRRSAIPASPTEQVDEQIEGIRSLEDYEQFVGLD